jgi:hypothetical protein
LSGSFCAQALATTIIAGIMKMNSFLIETSPLSRSKSHSI